MMHQQPTNAMQCYGFFHIRITSTLNSYVVIIVIIIVVVVIVGIIVFVIIVFVDSTHCSDSSGSGGTIVMILDCTNS